MGELRQRGRVWWVRYYRNGRRFEESSHSQRKEDAKNLLKLREGDVARGVPISPQVGRLRFDEGAKDLVNEYRANGKRSVDELERRIRLHLGPWFGGRRLAAIMTADVRAYTTKRQADTIVTRKARTVKRGGELVEEPEVRRTVSNAEINRELTTLKRIFSLAVQGAKLLHRPHIPLLRENNVRTGFFEVEQYRSLMAHLPAPLRPVVEFGYITGWRIASEVLPLEWRNVDFKAGEVRLDPGTTKNREGRVFPMTDDLRALLKAREAERDQLKKKGVLTPRVFFRVIDDDDGKLEARPIVTFQRSWQTACRAAGCPGRIPHDLRRTAVRNMVRRGVPERVAMRLTGHKTRSVFERYNIVSDGDLRTAAAQLAGLTGTKQGQSALAVNQGRSEVVEELEAAAGVEPANRGFADLRLTTWLRRLQQMTIREFRAAVQHAASSQPVSIR